MQLATLQLKLRIWMTLEEMRQTYLWRSRLLNVKEKEMTICYHYEQMFGNDFHRRESKCCGVLMKHLLIILSGVV